MAASTLPDDQVWEDDLRHSQSKPFMLHYVLHAQSLPAWQCISRGIRIVSLGGCL